MPQDFGRIQCIAKNEVGIQQKPCMFQIIVSNTPVFPYQCHVANQSHSSLMILCEHNASVKAEIGKENDLIYENFNLRKPNASSSTSVFKNPHYNAQQPLFVYPNLLYVCEVHKTNGQLIQNVTTTLSEQDNADQGRFKKL